MGAVNVVKGELIGGVRFKDLEAPICLPAGFHGTMVGGGYGPIELNGNTHGADSLPGFTKEDGGCLISFVGGGRFSPDPLLFPTNLDGGPANRYGNGTFEFHPATGDCILLGAPLNVVATPASGTVARSRPAKSNGLTTTSAPASRAAISLLFWFTATLIRTSGARCRVVRQTRIDVSSRPAEMMTSLARLTCCRTCRRSSREYHSSARRISATRLA